MTATQQTSDSLWALLVRWRYAEAFFFWALMVNAVTLGVAIAQQDWFWGSVAVLGLVTGTLLLRWVRMG